MAPPRILAVVLAGGAGQRLGLLTAERAKPAVPVGGSYRLIDFALSNCLHSGISDVLVVQQQFPASIAAVLENGRPWDLDRSHGGLVQVPPGRGGDREGWHEGTADALWKIAGTIREFSADVVVVVSADAIYRLDYHDLVQDHLSTEADLTMATIEVDAAEAGRLDVVQVQKNGKVTGYAHKPEEPKGNIVATEIFAFDPETLLDTLEELGDDGGEDSDLGDLGDRLLPTLVWAGRARAFPMTGYWRDVGTVDAYWEAHMDLLRPRPRFVFDDLNWPVLSSGQRNPAARVRASAEVTDSLLAGGCDVAGEVESSVLSPGVVVEKGAVVRRSVLLPGVRVRSGAVVEGAILDDEVTIGPDCQVTGRKGRITVIGHALTLRKGTVVGAGEHLPASTD